MHSVTAHASRSPAIIKCLTTEAILTNRYFFLSSITDINIAENNPRPLKWANWGGDRESIGCFHTYYNVPLISDLAPENIPVCVCGPNLLGVNTYGHATMGDAEVVIGADQWIFDLLLLQVPSALKWHYYVHDYQNGRFIFYFSEFCVDILNLFSHHLSLLFLVWNLLYGITISKAPLLPNTSAMTK